MDHAHVNLDTLLKAMDQNADGVQQEIIVKLMMTVLHLSTTVNAMKRHVSAFWDITLMTTELALFVKLVMQHATLHRNVQLQLETVHVPTKHVHVNLGFIPQKTTHHVFFIRSETTIAK